MTKGSLRKAHQWPYPRHRRFEETLREAASSWFEAKGFPVDDRYPFILADWADWPRNLLLPEVAFYIQKESAQAAAAGRPFPLHKYLHHGLSSQAMLFNLIGPLIVRNDLAPLHEVFAVESFSTLEDALSVSFEYEDRRVFNEDYGQPTSVDLVFRDSRDSPRLFVESKLVESEFGGCSVFGDGDCDGRNPASEFSLCYLHHIGRRYWDLLQKHGFLAGPLGRESVCLLSIHYQFFRELVFALELGGSFVLLSDERSPTFACMGPQGERRGLVPFLLQFVPELLRSRVAMVSVQQVVQAIKASGRHADWIAEFETKYGLAA